MSQAAGPVLGELDRRIAAASVPAMARAEFGYHSAVEPTQDSNKWVQLDLGRSLEPDRVVLWGCHDDFNNIGAGFGFPVRFKVEMSDDPIFLTGVVPVADRTGSDVPNAGIAAQTLPARGAKGRYIRVTATKLAPRQNDFNFALAELEVLDAAGTNLARGDRLLRPQVPGRPPSARAGRPVRADLERQRQWLPPPQLGLARGRPARSRPLALGMARDTAALIQDLKRLGLLDDTIILWTTEFGRMPSSQGGKGRDHNPYCFTNWLAGGGIKGVNLLRPQRRVWL